MSLPTCLECDRDLEPEEEGLGVCALCLFRRFEEEEEYRRDKYRA